MGKIYHDDAIAAIATPAGEGAIAVLRVSGKNSISLIDGIFRGKGGLTEAAGYTIHFGRIVSPDGEEIDEVLASVFRAPHSYTGEESVEVSCHGGVFVTQKVLSAILSCGIRQAEPGEFTKRAFLNGKLDLSQAEAVADLISSRGEAFYHAAMGQLEGRFSSKIKDLRTQILDLSSLLELELDFSEEGIDLISTSELLERIGKVERQLGEMIDSYQKGRLYREGVRVAIVGKPNAGKSSLFNALLRENRAIVNAIPGTTRDSLEETVSIGGVLFTLNDTAGLRETDDPVESEGVLRTRGILKRSDVILLVVDINELPPKNDPASLLTEIEVDPKKLVVVYNKIDIRDSHIQNAQTLQNETQVQSIETSAKTGLGLEELRDRLLQFTSNGLSLGGGVCVTNSRHLELLLKSKAVLSHVSESVKTGLTPEFISLDARDAADALAGIIGEVTSDDTLNNIFQRFCIGK